jgi:hypothetical protein
MNRLKHYHLGCGESLQSSWLELQRIRNTPLAERVKPRLNTAPNSKQAKQH